MDEKRVILGSSADLMRFAWRAELLAQRELLALPPDLGIRRVTSAGMAEANVERVRIAYEQFGRHDTAGWLSMCHPDIELVEPPEIPDASTSHGHEGAAAVVAKLVDAFPDMRFEPTSIVPSGDVVLVEIQWVGSGATSGAETGVVLFHLWSFKDGLAVRLDAFLDRSAAYTAAGITPTS